MKDEIDMEMEDLPPVKKRPSVIRIIVAILKGVFYIWWVPTNLCAKLFLAIISIGSKDGPVCNLPSRILAVCLIIFLEFLVVDRLLVYGAEKYGYEYNSPVPRSVNK